MAQKGFSAKGILVDFELLKVKEQLANIPVPTTVSARRTFIEEKAGLIKRDTSKPVNALLEGAFGLEEQGVDVESETDTPTAE